MMRKVTIPITVAALVCVLLLASAALAQSGGPGPPGAWFAVESGTASGGGYHLATLAWQASGTASGGNYRLLTPVRAIGRGTPCCCNYLPVILRNYQR